MLLPKKLLKELLYVRMVEEKIQELYSEQEMRCPVHLSLGQEAAAVGVCSALTAKDNLFTGHRSHAYYLAKGGDLKRFFAEIYGKATGCSAGRGGSMHVTDLETGFIASTPIVGGTIPLAVGAAFAKQYKKETGIAVSCIGDGSTEEGVFHESLNYAKLKNLPVLFVVENNLYSVYTPLCERQPERSIHGIAKAHGLNVFVIEDGNDVLAVVKTTQKAVQSIRDGNGPALIEMPTYRTVEHCGPNNDDDLGYRPKEEISEWAQRDPVEFFTKKLLANNTLTQQDVEQIKTEISKKITEAVTFAKESPFPEKKELEKHIYAQ